MSWMGWAMPDEIQPAALHAVLAAPGRPVPHGRGR